MPEAAPTTPAQNASAAEALRENDLSPVATQRHARGGYVTRPRRVIIHPDDIPACEATDRGRMILASAGYGDYNDMASAIGVIQPQQQAVTATDGGLVPHEPSSAGFVGTDVQGGYICAEYNARIRTLRDRLTVFEEMRRSEPAVAVIELLTTLPLAHTKFFFEDGDDEDFAEFLQFNIDEGLTLPFSETMRDAALGMLYGFTWCYPCYEPKRWKTQEGEDRIYTGWEQFEPRARATTYQWKFDQRGRCSGLIAYGVHPVTHEPHYVGYDADEILRFTWRPDGGDPEGLGALRQAFKPYSYLEATEEFAAIKIEREAQGVLVASCREDVPYDSADESKVLASMANIRAGRVNGITLPDGWEIKCLQIGSEGGIPFLDFIENRRRDILSTVGAQFVGGDIGSGIGQKDSSNVFLMLLDHAADWLCDCFNQQAMPQISRLNGVVEQKKTKLCHGPVGVKDIEKYAMALEKITRHPETIPDAALEIMNEEMGLPSPPAGAQQKAMRQAQRIKMGNAPMPPAQPSTEPPDANMAHSVEGGGDDALGGGMMDE